MWKIRLYGSLAAAEVAFSRVVLMRLSVLRYSWDLSTTAAPWSNYEEGDGSDEQRERLHATMTYFALGFVEFHWLTGVHHRTCLVLPRFQNNGI